MDLRAEPLVITLPEIEDDRYYSVQLIDLYSHNTGYLGSRSDGNSGGNFLIAGPDWQGEAPDGIARVVQMDTQIAFGLFRTQLFSPADIGRVVEIQARYRAQPLSTFAGNEPPAPAPEIDWPEISREIAQPQFWDNANFLLQFAPSLPWEANMRDAFALVGMAPSEGWPATDMDEPTRTPIQEAGSAALDEIAKSLSTVTTSVDLFGTPDDMRGNEMERAVGAMGGLSTATRPPRRSTPAIKSTPTENLWMRRSTTTSCAFLQTRFPGRRVLVATMYDAETRLLVRNPLDRYLLNSSMLDGIVPEPNGDIVLYLQSDSPGEGLEDNWLPAPDGPFSAVLRLYLPKPEALDGRWVAPSVTRVMATSRRRARPRMAKGRSGSTRPSRLGVESALSRPGPGSLRL